MQKDLNGATQKKISEYLHYYLGCEIKAEGKGTMTYTLNKIGANGFASFKDKNGFDVWLGEGWKPMLRKLDSLTEEEKKHIGFEAYNILRGEKKLPAFQEGKVWAAHQTHYLFSRRIWLFGNDWFDEGLIIDKATVK